MAFNFRGLLKWCVVFAYVFYSSDGFMAGKEFLDTPVIRHKRSYQLKNRTTSSQNSNQADKEKSPVFATENCTVVVAQVGGTATLPCVVRKFNNGVICEDPDVQGTHVWRACWKGRLEYSTH